MKIRSLSAGAVVGKHTGGRVIHPAAFPIGVGHPEVGDHGCLAGIVFFKNVPVEQTFFGEGRTVRVFFTPETERVIAVQGFGILLQIIHHGMADGVREGRFLPPEDLRRENVILLKCMTEEILSHPVAVELQFRVDVHDVSDKVEIAEGNEMHRSARSTSYM